MPIETLLTYMNLCRALGRTPSWDGLRAYALERKRRGERCK